MGNDETKKALEETTKASEETAKASEETAKASEETTKASEETTKALEETTKASEETTKASEETTKASEETTKASEEAKPSKKEGTRKASIVKILGIALLAAIIVIAAVFAFPRPVLAPDKPEESPTPTPTEVAAAVSAEFTDVEPSPAVRAAFIPDPDELQPMPEMVKLNLVEDYITSEIMGGTLIVRWPEKTDSDYSVLCVLDAKGNILIKEILWAEITEWELHDFAGASVLLICYKDMGEDSGEDDEIVGTYILNAAPAATPTPEPTDKAAKKPSSTPEPTQAQNKYYIIVDKADHSFSIFTYDEKGEYTKRVATFPCAVGRSSRTTPNGKFKISSKGPWKKWSSGHYSPYYTKYTSGLYFHGAVYNKKDGSTMRADSYNEIGTNASAGCIRTTYAGAYWVYANCPAGTVVEIVASSDLVPHVTKPPIDPDLPKWDPTDPNKPEAPEPSPSASAFAPVEPTESAEATGPAEATGSAEATESVSPEL